MNRGRMQLVLAFAAVLVLGSLGWLVSLSKTSQAAPAPPSDAAFKGKVLLVTMHNTMFVFLMEKAQVQRIGDRPCLVGKGAADGDLLGWSKGRTVWLPMEHIVSITEFDDRKEAKKALESSDGTPFVFRGEGITRTPEGPAPPPNEAPPAKR